jgi:hypothetical protein
VASFEELTDGGLAAKVLAWLGMPQVAEATAPLNLGVGDPHARAGDFAPALRAEVEAASVLGLRKLETVLKHYGVASKDTFAAVAAWRGQPRAASAQAAPQAAHAASAAAAPKPAAGAGSNPTTHTPKWPKWTAPGHHKKGSHN